MKYDHKKKFPRCMEEDYSGGHSKLYFIVKRADDTQRYNRMKDKHFEIW